MDLFEKIFSGATKPPDRDSNTYKSYFREKNRINQHYNKLVSSLSDDDLKILEKLIDSEHRLTKIENMRFFAKGLKLGMNFTLEALE